MNIFGTEIIQINNLYLTQYKQIKSIRTQGKNYHCLSYRHCGHIRLHLDKEFLVEAKKGMITFVPQGWNYYHEVMEDSEVTALHFNSNELMNSTPFSLKPMNEKVFPILFNNAATIWDENPSYSSIPLLAVAYKILEAVIKENDEYLKSGNSMITIEAINYLRKNFSEIHLTIADCAKAVGITEAYLRRIFKKALNKSPGQFLLQIRMDNAKNLLSTGYYTVNEVAVRSGFCNQSHFSSVFRKYTGFSPVAYIKNS